MYNSMDELIEEAYNLPDGHFIEIEVGNMTVLGGPSEETAEGNDMSGVTYHHTKDGRAWLTVQITESTYWAIPSDHHYSRHHAAIKMTQTPHTQPATRATNARGETKMYRRKLEALARTLTTPSAPFSAMPTFFAGKGDDGNYFIADNGQQEFSGTKQEFVEAFPDIAIYDLNVHFDNDDLAVNAAIEAAV